MTVWDHMTRPFPTKIVGDKIMGTKEASVQTYIADTL